VRRLAAVGAGDRLDVRGPLPAGLEGGASQGAGVDVHEFELALAILERPGLFGRVEALAVGPSCCTPKQYRGHVTITLTGSRDTADGRDGVVTVKLQLNEPPNARWADHFVRLLNAQRHNPAHLAVTARVDRDVLQFKANQADVPKAVEIVSVIMERTNVVAHTPLVD
jgi:hypothetical protein